RRIACPLAGQIYIIDTSGSNLRQLTTGDGPNFAPNWSHDGSALTYASDRPGSVSDIYRINLDGSGETRLTYGVESDSGATWQPDENPIAPEPPQSYTISGRVTNAFGAGLPGIDIEYAPGFSTATDANGNFAIQVSSVSNYLIKPNKPGYVFD